VFSKKRYMPREKNAVPYISSLAITKQRVFSKKRILACFFSYLLGCWDGTVRLTTEALTLAIFFWTN
jgi:hypothetical protein